MTALLIAAALVFTPSDAHLALATARTLVDSHTPRNSGTAESAAAALFIASEAKRFGSDVTVDSFKTMSAGTMRTFTNVYAEFRSGESSRCRETNEWMVVVSHFDTKHGIDCPGANDGAATSGLLLGLSQAWRHREAPSNLLLIWTDGEECVNRYGLDDGLQGSKRAAEMLAKSGKKVKAVIIADMIGDRDLQISVPLNSSPRLRAAAIAAAQAIGEPKLVSPLLGMVVDDHVPFMEKDFAAIDLIDFSYGPDNGYWHTAQDTMDKVSEASLLKSGKLIGELLK